MSLPHVLESYDSVEHCFEDISRIQDDGEYAKALQEIARLRFERKAKALDAFIYQELPAALRQHIKDVRDYFQLGLGLNHEDPRLLKLQDVMGKILDALEGIPRKEGN